MRILITGGQGQLGRALEDAFVGDDVRAPGHSELDITDRTAVADAIQGFRPEAVVHSAAWTDTAGCEGDPEQAILVNATGAGNVAEACVSVGASIIYVSSNEVFDGKASEPYREDAQTGPLNSYGLSKLAGERAVAMALPAHCIVRTSWLYGPGRVSFPEKVLKAARETGSVKMVTDEIAGPTYTIDLARGIAELVRLNARGIFHLANAGGCSRLEWALAILEITGMTDVPVEAVTQADFGAAYRKPVFSTLANMRGAEMGVTLRPWREALVEHLLEPAKASGAPNSLQ